MNRHEKTDDFDDGAAGRIRQLNLRDWYPFAGLVLVVEYLLLGLLGG